MALFTITNQADTINSFDKAISDVAIDSQGNIICYGEFTEYGGTVAKGLIKIKPNGDVDNTFSTGTGFSPTFVYSGMGMQIDSNDNIYIGGYFTSYNGTGANRIISIDNTGAINSNFVYGAGTNNYQLRPALINNNLYVPGLSSTYNGTGHDRIFKTDLLGNIDATFSANMPSLNNLTRTIAFDGTNLYLEGYFAQKLLKFDEDGNVDATFSTNIGTGPNNINTSGTVGELIYSPTNNSLWYFAQYTTSFNGVPTQRLIRLNLDGTIHTTFSIATGPNDDVYYMDINSNGYIFIRGKFTEFAGNPVNNGIAILDPNGVFVSTVTKGGSMGDVRAVGELFYATEVIGARRYLVRVTQQGIKTYI